ncbi:MerR family transcriptional regulator [Streptomyces somaliensis DSM 40738]|uniref:MerR family transcriptional regulator n=1 Tax=Streptomyces somaliensis (strain ATCC 33201 / DSM 40738 / JCM 12659 / KCTC 9044 / NCTC 11332 / NRRL B-12077 / IP 733) TaxID=1134445 RepID=A0AA44DE85_STRE0|nr:MerR family transcriptional regulator [Streptomyces somaliensis]MCQ0021700.1 MerR family transcriptional regulator [Streptomyces somaliensis DSM 40738]NKY14879.1 MerR family transcriptional regulator [Streptomyces somaliensis DSM 40738]
MADDRLKAADLARSAGVSVQQLRTYADTGLLPPVERTAAGYRVFTRAHADALAVARELAAGHGWATARTVMAAVHAGDLETALAALDAGHARLDRERAELAVVREALGAVLKGRAPSPRRGLRIGEAARAVGVKPPVLRLWEAHGLVRPRREPSTGYRVYDRSELHVAQVVALLRKGRHPLAAIESVLRELRAGGGPDRVLAELDARARDLHRSSLRRLGASAALHGYLGRLGHC